MKTHFSIFVLLCLFTIICQAQTRTVENMKIKTQNTPIHLNLIGTDTMNISDEQNQGKWKRTHEDEVWLPRSI